MPWSRLAVSMMAIPAPKNRGYRTSQREGIVDRLTAQAPMSRVGRRTRGGAPLEVSSPTPAGRGASGRGSRFTDRSVGNGKCVRLAPEGDFLCYVLFRRGCSTLMAPPGMARPGGTESPPDGPSRGPDGGKSSPLAGQKGGKPMVQFSTRITGKIRSCVFLLAALTEQGRMEYSIRQGATLRPATSYRNPIDPRDPLPTSERPQSAQDNPTDLHHPPIRSEVALRLDVLNSRQYEPRQLHD